MIGAKFNNFSFLGFKRVRYSICNQENAEQRREETSRQAKIYIFYYIINSGMGLLEDRLIELDFFSHPGLFISWPNSIKESVLTEGKVGKIAINSSGVPYLVYFLAKKTGADFLSFGIVEKVKKEKFISFAGMGIKEFRSQADYILDSRKIIWELLENERIKDQISNEELRFLKELFPHHDYIGYIPPSAEYPGVNILHKKDIYLSQRRNILRLDKELSKELVRRTIKHYGLAVSSCLNALRG